MIDVASLSEGYALVNSLTLQKELWTGGGGKMFAFTAFKADRPLANRYTAKGLLFKHTPPSLPLRSRGIVGG